MKNTFMVSLCKNGLLGGYIVMEEEAMIYRTGKVTIPQKHRNLVMKYNDIKSLTKEKMLFMTTISVQMKNMEEYKFLVFNEKRFLEVLQAKRNGK